MKTRQDIVDLKIKYQHNDIIKNLLMSIIADCDRISTTPPVNEIQILEVIKTTYKNNIKSLSDYQAHDLQFEIHKIQQENKFLEEYLPKQLVEGKMQSIVDQLYREGFNNIGQFMKYFKENYNGLYNGQILSMIIKEKLR